MGRERLFGRWHYITPWSLLYVGPTREMKTKAKKKKKKTVPLELLPGTLYLLILRTLTRGPLHGYAIARRIKEASEDSLSNRGYVLLFPSLNRMIVKGWLTAEWGTSENNRKARFYRLTPRSLRRVQPAGR